MRIVLAILASLIMLDASAQTPSQSKWQLQKYSGISAGAIYWGGNSVSYLSAPLGLQLSYPLNKNLYAFTGAYIAPTAFNFSSFMRTSAHYPGLQNGYGFSINPGVTAGLMYINDDKTFSISGRVSLERSNYLTQPYNNLIGPQHPAPMQIVR